MTFHRERSGGQASFLVFIELGSTHVSHALSYFPWYSTLPRCCPIFTRVTDCVSKNVCHAQSRRLRLTQSFASDFGKENAAKSGEGFATIRRINMISGILRFGFLLEWFSGIEPLTYCLLGTRSQVCRCGKLRRRCDRRQAPGSM